ncbi:transmembrane protein 71 [Ctenodactylus gundi]
MATPCDPPITEYLMITNTSDSFRSDRECAGELSTRYSFPSFTCDFLDGDSAFECCWIDSLAGSHYACHRSPRLLINGYYIWTEDSFLCGKDGNITLKPSQTSVMYKGNLGRIFRKKKRIRHSLSSLLNISTSKSWLRGSTYGDVDSYPSEDIWIEGVRKLATSQCRENGDFDSSSQTDDWELEDSIVESSKASFSEHVLSQPARESSQDSNQFPLEASGHFQDSILNHSKSSLLWDISSQALLLVVCFIISACARWCLGGGSANVFTCTLVVTIACK